MSLSRSNLFLVFLSVFLGTLLLPLLVRAENIERFASDIDVRADGSFTVTETIEYRFTEERHGIFRKIPLLHPEKASAFFRDRIIEVDLKSVTQDGSDVPFVLESTRDMFVVRIGDPNTTINGPHTYTLTYEVRGGLSYPVGQGVELYWNVTGNDWEIPIRVAEATIGSNASLFRTERSCYRGTFGVTSGSCTVLSRGDGKVFFRTTDLFEGEGITVAQALDATKVAKDIRERTNYIWFIVPLAFFAFIYGGFRMYAYQTANKTGRTIIPEYEPYPDTKPMYAGLLMDGKLDPRDLTAAIVYLAEQGYLKIRKTERKVLFLFEVDDYEIILKKEPDAALGIFERKIIELLFDAPYAAGTAVALSTLKNSESERRSNYIAFQALEKDLREDLQAAGFYEHFKFQRMLTIFGGILSAGLVMSLLIFGAVNGALLIFLAFAGIITILIMNRRRTRKGYEALDHLKGFKLFLEMTDRDRFAFHNAPEKSPEQFMEFLPYAIAFGVEKAWAKTFEGFTMPNPDWYEGGSVSSFSSSNLSSSLGAFSSAFAASSGASASSGGGSSGGGSGGGGGGSW